MTHFHLTVLISVLLFVTSSGLRTQYCEKERHHVVVNEDADAFIGLILPVHQAGSGLLGCGTTNREGVEMYEAGRWFVSQLNKKIGQVEGRIVTDSYIPGITIGLKVYDSCQHQVSAVDSFAELFPVLRAGGAVCGGWDNDTSIMLGIVDATRASTSHLVGEQVRNYHVPVVSVTPDTFIPAEDKAKAMVLFAEKMQWKKLAILHSTDEYSIGGAKALGKWISEKGICLTNIASVPSSSSSLAPYRAAIESILSSNDSAVGVAVFLSQEALAPVLSVLGTVADLESKMQWLFSDLLIDVPASRAVVERTRKVFSVSPYPDVMTDLEFYLNDVKKQKSRSEESRWYLEHWMTKKHCRLHGVAGPNFAGLPMCRFVSFDEDRTDKVLRTFSVIPILHGMHIYAQALKEAWKVKCASNPGMCKNLLELTNREFLEEFLDKAEFRHDGPGMRISKSLSGGKNKHGEAGKVVDMALGLTHYVYNGNHTDVAQVMKVRETKVDIMDSRFFYNPAPCTGDTCNNCLQIRAPRVETLDKEPTPEESVMVPSDQDILIPALFPVHKMGPTPLECSTEINPEGLQSLEAFLWALNRIKQNSSFLPGIEVGTMVFDSCSSPVRTTNLISSLLKKNRLNFTQPTKFSPSDILTVIGSLGPKETAAAEAVLAPMNITTITSRNTGLWDLTSKYRLQVPLPLIEEVYAMLEVMKYNDWNFVSVVYSGESKEHRSAFERMKTLSKQSGICFSSSHSITSGADQSQFRDVIQSIRSVTEIGSNVVVLLTTSEDTESFVKALRSFSGTKSPRLMVLSSHSWPMDQSSTVEADLEDTIYGVIVLRPEAEAVQDFATFFRHLRPEINPVNPWFREYWKQEILSKGQRLNHYTFTGDDSSIIEGLQAVSEALYKIHQDLCGGQEGLCERMKDRSELRQILNSYLRHSDDLGPGKSSHFGFTQAGYGRRSVEILGRRKIGRGATYRKVGTFSDKKIQSLLEIKITSSTGEDLPLSSLQSTCFRQCGGCGAVFNRRLVRRSPQNLYIGATFPLHSAQGGNPLECGELRSIQHMEALLWSLEQVNRSPLVLPGIELGVVGFDSCSSKERVSREVLNFFSEADTFGSDADDSVVRPSDVITFIATGAANEVLPVLDVTVPMGITTAVTDVYFQLLDKTSKYRRVIKMAPTVSMKARGIVSLLQQFGWTYVSALYDDDSIFMKDLYDATVAESKHSNVKFAVRKAVDHKRPSRSLDEVKSHIQGGARVVVLLAEGPVMETVLKELKNMTKDDHSMADLLFLIPACINEANNWLQDGLMPPGSLLLVHHFTVTSPDLTEFTSHLNSLRPTNNTENPWFREYWSQVTGCQGKECYRSPLRQFAVPSVDLDPNVASVIDSVYAVSHGLEKMRKLLCPGYDGLCSAMNSRTIRKLLYNFTASVVFSGSAENTVSFSEMGVNTAADVQFLNYRKVGTTAFSFVDVGSYSRNAGLNIVVSKMKRYTHDLREGSITDLKSVCTTCTEAPKGRSLKPKVMNTASFLQVLPRKNFALTGIVPYHQQGANLFKCGGFHSHAVFQNLAAITYAIDRLNRNSTLLPGIELGALIFDYCDRTDRARERLFSYFSGELQEMYDDVKVAPPAVVASLSFDDVVADEVSNILRANEITHFSSSVIGSETRPESQVVRTVPPATHEVQAVHAVIEAFQWTYIGIVFSDDEYGHSCRERFLNLTAPGDICLGVEVSVGTPLSPYSADRVMSALLQAPGLSVVVVFVEDPATLRELLLSAASREVTEKFTFISSSPWGNDRRLVDGAESAATGAITVTMEHRDIPDFRKYFASLTLKSHFPFPDSWFEEFYQDYHGCRISSSTVSRLEYPDECTGYERVDVDEVEVDPHVYHTILAVDTVAKGLHSFLEGHCQNGFESSSIDECAASRKELNTEIMKAVNSFSTHKSGSDLYRTHSSDIDSMGPVVGFDIWNYQNLGNYNFDYVRVGRWKNAMLDVETSRVFFKDGSTVPKSECGSLECMKKCAPQSPMYARQAVPKPPPIESNFHTIWGIVTSAISAFNIAIVITCVLYFIVTFPTTTGTTLLGYWILVGVLILNATNFAFILQPSSSTCGIRRFCLGLSYCIIYSGMLVKVINTWRLMDREGRADVTTDTFSQPRGLVLITTCLVLVQVLLVSAWMVLMPPSVALYGQTWRCAPVETFEVELTISLVYVMILVAATLLFSFLTWQSLENNRESRWILVTSIFTSLIWICWNILSTQAPLHYRDVATVVANILCTAAILLFLYARKVYLYSKFSKEAKELEMRSHLSGTTLYGPSVYSATNPNIGTAGVHGVKWNPIANPALTGGLPSSSSVEEDIIEEDFDIHENSDEEDGYYKTPTAVSAPEFQPPTPPPLPFPSGRDSPSQVVPSPLYPMHMFDPNPAEQDCEDTEEELTPQHCRPGTNEFQATVPVVRRVGSREMLCFKPEEFTGPTDVSRI